jgi:hypothetical protein
LLHLFALFSGGLSSLWADQSPVLSERLPFQLGERLEYEMKWGFFPVGSAVMEVFAQNQSQEKSPIVVRFQVRTNSFADNFYKVRTSITSILDPGFSRTLEYRKSQHEGKTKREIEVLYDYEKGEVSYTENQSEPRVTDIPGYVFDPLSIAYFFRLNPLTPGAKTVLPTCDGKRFQEVVVTAGQREKISLPNEKVFAIETNPSLKNLGGVFNKSPKGMLKVWYTDDQRRVPVRVSSKVVVGSFTASLVRANPPLSSYE